MMRRRRKKPMPRSLTFSPSTPKNLSTLPKNHSDAAWHASTDADAPRLADLSAAFASSVDPELAREAAPRLAAVLRRMSAFYSSQGAPRCSLLPLTMALRKMQRSGCPAPPGGGGGSAGGEITPLHPLLFEAALQAQNPRAALPVLDDLLGGGGGGGRGGSGGGKSPAAAAPPEISLAPETTGVSTRDVLLTFYLGGLLRAARREWDLSSAAFALAIGAVPAAAAPSSIASEALKRWTLVRVAAGRGSFPSLSELPAARAASPAVVRSVKADAAAYLELARAAGRGVSAYAAAAAKEGGAPFCSPGSGDGDVSAAATGGDGQLGLLRAAVRGERDRALAALSRVYAALPLRDVLSKAGERGAGRRASPGAAAAAGAPPPAVEEDEEEGEEEGGGEGEEEAAAAALSTFPRGAAEMFDGDEEGEGGGEEVMEQDQQGEQQQAPPAGAAATTPAARGLRSRAGPPRSSTRRGGTHQEQQQQQQPQPSPGSRRATAEAHAAAVAAARAASASFEASLLPARLASKGKEEDGADEEEEAERALWSLADAALAALSSSSSPSSSSSSSSPVSSFELPALAHSTLVRIDAVARTVSFENEAEAAGGSGASPSVSPLALRELRRTLDAVVELTARVRAAAREAKTEPGMVRRAVERQQRGECEAAEAEAARERERERRDAERQRQEAGGGSDVDFAVA